MSSFRTLALLLSVVLTASPAFSAPKNYDEAYGTVRDQAKKAYLSPVPVADVLTEQQLADLGDPKLPSKDEPGTRKEKTAKLLSALKAVQTLQGFPGAPQLSPSDKRSLIIEVQTVLELSADEHSRAIGIYKPKSNVPAPFALNPPESILRAQEASLAQARRSAAGAGGQAEALKGTVPGDLSGVPGAAVTPGAGRLLTPAALAALNAVPDAQHPSLHTGPAAVVPAPSFIDRQNAAAALALARSNGGVDARFRADYAQDENLIASGAAFWHERQSADILPGEGAAAYVWRRTSATVMGGFLDPLSNFRESVARAAYYNASGDIGEGARSRANEAVVVDGAVAAFTLVPVGAPAKTAAAGVRLTAEEARLALSRPGAVARVTQGASEAEAYERLLAGDAADLNFTAAGSGTPSRTVAHDVYDNYKKAKSLAARGDIESQTVMDSVGVDARRIDSVLPMDKQTGSTCARNGITVCAVVNSPSLHGEDPMALLAKVEDKSRYAVLDRELPRLNELKKRLGQPLSDAERARVQARIDELQARVDAAKAGGAAHQRYGIDAEVVDGTIVKMGWTSEGAVDASAQLQRLRASLRGAPNGVPVTQAMTEFEGASRNIKAAIDARLQEGKGVMAAVYTGYKEGGTVAGTTLEGKHTLHVVTVLRKGTNLKGEVVYVVHDSNQPGITIAVPEKDFLPFRAQVVSAGT